MRIELEHDASWVPLPGIGEPVADDWRDDLARRVAARWGLDGPSASRVVDEALGARRETDETTFLSLVADEPASAHLLVAHADASGDVEVARLVGLGDDGVLAPAVDVVVAEHLDEARVAKHLLAGDDGDLVGVLVLGARRGPWHVRLESSPVSPRALGQLHDATIATFGTLRLVD
ncbi:hypothetical protein [Agrococcus jejuensis]|uniref:Uncharacterized protein n=1 Tax=Agrococcus jejuensis TaxID=399736 RepID=A0A1G8BSK1_9MICO|nr:hypothetical protein [Agrococcus jejuensis]SDH36141.1 hypothetical protein SAMN04489720_1041 [Agrococcus jejuensis]